MSTVKVQGSATGTANFTVTVPGGTSTDRTFTLPDSTGTFITTGDTGSVSSTMLAANSVVAGKIATGAVDKSKLASSLADFAINTKKFGIGQVSATSRDLQLLTWTGTKNNGTITLLTQGTVIENPYVGIIGLNMMASGLGVSRLYFLTGRFAASTLTMYQGGNRGAGEDAYISFTGGTNSFGLTMTSSGFPSDTGYAVWAILGVQVPGLSQNDKWFAD